MANTIRLKRRASGGAAGAPSSLKTGEPAFNEVDNVLYLGLGDDGSGNANSIEAVAGKGAFVDLASNQTVGGSKTFGSVSVSGAAGTVRQLNLNTAGVLRWIVRASAEAETGSDNGSHFEIISRDDSGGFKHTVLKFNRQTGRATFSIGPLIRTLALDGYTVATVPVPSSLSGQFIFVTNGDAGAPCLAYSNGTNWLVIPISATPISAS